MSVFIHEKTEQVHMKDSWFKCISLGELRQEGHLALREQLKKLPHLPYDKPTNVVNLFAVVLLVE